MGIDDIEAALRTDVPEIVPDLDASRSDWGDAWHAGLLTPYVLAPAIEQALEADGDTAFVSRLFGLALRAASDGDANADAVIWAGELIDWAVVRDEAMGDVSHCFTPEFADRVQQRKLELQSARHTRLGELAGRLGEFPIPGRETGEERAEGALYCMDLPGRCCAEFPEVPRFPDEYLPRPDLGLIEPARLDKFVRALREGRVLG